MTRFLTGLLGSGALVLGAPLTAQTTTAQTTTAQTSAPSQTMPTAPAPTVPASAVPPAAPAPAAPTVATPATPAPAPAAPVAQTVPGNNVAVVVAGHASLSALRAALDTAELTQSLAVTGPFTLFAPDDAAFNRLNPATRAQLMTPTYRTALQTLLNYHVVAGNLTSAELRRQITAGGGVATLQTVAGQSLTARIENGHIVLFGQNGSKGYVMGDDITAANGTVHILNGVLVPHLS